MKNILLIIITFYFVSCCNNSENKIFNKNLLLDTSVFVKHLYQTDTANTLWNVGFDKSEIFAKLFNALNNNSLEAYSPFTDENKFEKYQKDYIVKNLGGSLKLNEIKGILFNETWDLDTSYKLNFTKTVLSWLPIRFYQNDSESLKKLVFKIKSNNNTSDLLAKNVIYEFNLSDTINPEFVEKINRNRLIEILNSFVLRKKIKAYDPFNIKKELTLNELKAKLGTTTDTLIIEDPITFKVNKQVVKKEINLFEFESIIFIEDWYYNSYTFSINKVIKGIAPVRHLYKIDEKVKSVPYVIYLTDEHINLF